MVPPLPYPDNSYQINGGTKQNGTTADMIFRIPRLIEHISSIMTLEVRSSLSLINMTFNMTNDRKAIWF